MARKIDPKDSACKNCEHNKGGKCYMKYCNYEPISGVSFETEKLEQKMKNSPTFNGTGIYRFEN